jgi:hypothetical protein
MKNKAEAEKRVKGLKTARNVGRAFDREGWSWFLNKRKSIR